MSAQRRPRFVRRRRQASSSRSRDCRRAHTTCTWLWTGRRATACSSRLKDIEISPKYLQGKFSILFVIIFAHHFHRIIHSFHGTRNELVLRSVLRYGCCWDVILHDSVGGAFGLPLIPELGRVPFVFDALRYKTRLRLFAGVMFGDVNPCGFAIQDFPRLTLPDLVSVKRFAAALFVLIFGMDVTSPDVGSVTLFF